jgi:preprotein translocase subunit SecE
MSKLNKTQEYIASVKAEAKKVTWPTKRELWESSLVVIAFIFILAITTGVCDKVINFVLGLFLSK